MSDARSVVVIGGGVIGAASAFYLQRAGWQVTLVEREKFGAACSHGNCGLVCPSHVLPLAEPGAIAKSLKSMLSSASPFYIKPRLDPTLWRWLANFGRRCNTSDMLSDGRVLHALLQSSQQLYDELVTDGTVDCEYERKGLLFVYQHEHYFEHYEETNQLLTREFNLPAKKLKGAELNAFEPSLKEGLAGGWFYEDDAHLRPDKLMASLRKRLEDGGAKIVEGTVVSEFCSDGGKVVSVKTSAGELKADAFVLAVGAVTPKFGSALGCEIPIQPGKGYSLTMPRPKICPTVPMIFVEHKVAITPFQTGYRIGSTMEFAGYDSTMNQSRINLLKTGSEVYLREPYCEPVEETWYGWRPMTYDSVPVIDFSPKFKNVLVAAGHGMLGISTATGTGKLVSEMLSGARPHIEPAGFGLGRFA